MFKIFFSVKSNSTMKVRQFFRSYQSVSVLIEREWISELKPCSYYIPKVANGIKPAGVDNYSRNKRIICS